MYHFRTSEYVPSDAEDDVDMDKPTYIQSTELIDFTSNLPYDDDELFELTFETKAPSAEHATPSLIDYVSPPKHEEMPYFENVSDLKLDNSFVEPLLEQGNYLEQHPLQMDKRTVIIELDKVLVDIVLEEQFEQMLNSQYKMQVQSAKNILNIQRVDFNGYNMLLAYRKDTVQFLQILSQCFNIYIFTYIQPELAQRVVKLIDPAQKYIKQSRITYFQSFIQGRIALKDSSMLSQRGEDYLIFDKNERDWVASDMERIILLKCFAPLSGGPVIIEPSLKEIPIRLNDSTYDENPDVYLIQDKFHICTLEESKTEATLTQLATSVIDVFKEIRTHFKLRFLPTGSVLLKYDNLMVIFFKQYFGILYKDKTFCRDYMCGYKSTNPKLSSRDRFIETVITRLGGSMVSSESGERIDFYLLLNIDPQTQLTYHPDLKTLTASHKVEFIAPQKLISYYLRLRFDAPPKAIPKKKLQQKASDLHSALTLPRAEYSFSNNSSSDKYSIVL